jgi:hypothetical protein
VKELAVGGKGRKRRRKSAEGRGRSSRLLFYRWCECGFVGRLSRCLLVEEKVYVGYSGVEDMVEREGKEERIGCELRNDWFFCRFWTQFSSCSSHEIHIYL